MSHLFNRQVWEVVTIARRRVFACPSNILFRRLRTLLASLVAFGFSLAAARPISLTVPNPSFESPVTTFVNTHIDSWQKPPKPDYYVESGGYTWDQLAGTFKNTPTNSSDHIDNCDGNQAIWIFAVPDIGLFQDYDSIDWQNLPPTHGLNVIYEVGKSYLLTVGVIGGGGNMLPGVSLDLSLYYRDAASNQVAVAVTSITNSPDIFPTTTHLVDFQVSVPSVQASDPWAGQHLGIHFASTVSSNLAGGYWDLDNVRLSSISPPALVAPVFSNGFFNFTLQSDPGLQFSILTSTNASAPLSNWSQLMLVTNITGSTTVTDSSPLASQKYYRALQLP
jgi:hypothetical protein